MSKFNSKVASRATTNLAGGKAYSMNPEMELVHAVLTTFLEDKFYEKGADRISRIAGLIKQVKPEFVSNLAIVARKEFNLRSVTHVLVGELAKIHTGDSLVKDTIVEVALRPDDLMEIVSYVGTPMPNGVKRGVRNAILKYSPYQLAKYKGEGKGVSLVDLFNLTHPKAQHASDEQKDAWNKLMKGELKAFDTWENDVSNAKDEAGRKKAYENLIAENKMGYMAVLRNLNNFIKYGIDGDIKAKVIAKLTDTEEVKRSKQLPFRFTTAFENVKGDRAYSDAISEAMDIAVSNTPELEGNILIAVDSSGSMSGNPMDKASIFGATLLKANKNADLILYDTSVKELSLSGRTPVIDLANKIKEMAMGGGTDTSLVFQYAKKAKKEYSRIIIISDNESWRSYSVQATYDEYKKERGVNPFVYAIDIEGCGTTDITGKSVFHLTGWSDRLLDFIGRIEQGDTLVKYIKEYVPKSKREVEEEE